MNQDSAMAATLRSKLDVRRPAVAMAAHNPLAAKLAASAGFDAIWGSGFELSASYAVPDASILSMDMHLEMMRAIGEVQDAPVIADIDTGFGNAVNVAYVVPRYGDRYPRRARSWSSVTRLGGNRCWRRFDVPRPRQLVRPLVLAAGTPP
jgi:2-methylisocitrate lyase-like PEP mutase family enzyme